jgi:ABC-type multidrug transport system permease subunit
MHEFFLPKMFIGFSAPMAGIMVSLTTQVPFLQVMSLIIGSCVGIIAIVNGLITLIKSFKK